MNSASRRILPRADKNLSSLKIELIITILEINNMKAMMISSLILALINKNSKVISKKLNI